MKRIASILSLIFTAHLAFAVPAKPVWQTVTLADGTTVRVMKCGDENFSFFKTDNGQFLLREADGTYRAAEQSEVETLRSNAPRRQTHAAKNAARRISAKGIAQKAATRAINDGKEKRGLVIMVSFSDQDFLDANAWQTWNDILNKDGYKENGAEGSVHNYFKDQSRGQFNLKFDLIGPIQLPKSHYYYGDNGTQYGGLDIHMAECVTEACKAIDDKVDFTTYDWDGDGEADQVFILYAGCGEHSTLEADERLIWPHEFFISEYAGYEEGITLDGVKIDTYACGSELDCAEDDPDKKLSGLGTFCHEFSHCLGLPDLYDTRGYGLDMLEDWDLLSLGCYNLEGWCPPNYSAYEREFCGWQQPTLLTEPTSVTNMKALSEGGESYRINNDAQDTTKVEYYMIENRQKTGWDKSLPGHGVLITHIYYRKLYWDNNAVNSNYNYPGVAFIPANNIKQYSADVAWPYTDPETGLVNDSLTDNSKPAAKVFNKSINGTKFMGKPLTKIKVTDGIASFNFCKADTNVDNAIEAAVADRNAALYGQPATIYDAMGRKVASTEAFNGIDNLPSGLYIIKGEDGRSLKVIR